jgi:hypothetical protein
MSYVRLQDTVNGIEVYFRDVPTGYVDPNHKVLWSEQLIATLDRARPHTIRFEIKLVPGQDNDIVRVYVDDAAKACGTTWENYYRYDIEQQGTVNANGVPAIDRMQFRSNIAAPTADQALALAGKGFLFDNVTVTTSATGGPSGCDLPPAGPQGPAGPPGPSQPVLAGGAAGAPAQSAGRLIGDTRRVLHVAKRKGERFLSARATLRNRRLPVHGRTVVVDLRGKPVGNYNVYIRARYRTKAGKVRIVHSMRALSVTRALRDANPPS